MKPMAPLVDPPAHILQRARSGDPAAFEVLVHHYQDRVYALCYRLTYHRELARDITQDIFLRLYERLDRYDPTKPFTPWFMRLATNYALNARQKANRSAATAPSRTSCCRRSRSASWAAAGTRA